MSRHPVAALILLFLASPLHAAGYQTVGTDVRSMGQGETGVATPNAPGNAYQNPAAAVASPGLRGSVGAIGIYPHLAVDGSAGRVEALPSPSAPPNLHLSFATEHFGAGGSLTIPFGTSTQWPTQWHQRFLIQRSSLSSLRVTLFVAGKWGPLSVAAGPMLDRGALSLQRAVDFIEEEGQVTLSAQATGLGAHTALYLQLTPTLTLGASWHSSVSMRLQGRAEFDVPREFSLRAASGPMTVPMTLPAQGRLGLRWAPLSSMEVSVEIEGTQWAVVRELHIDFENEHATDLVKPRRWTSTLSPRAGVNIQALPALTLRGGIYFDPSPVPQATIGPDTPDSARVGVTLGCTLQATPTLGVNLGYQYLHFTGASSPSDAPAPLTFSGNAHLLGLSVDISL